MGIESTWDGADLPEHNHEAGDVEYKPRESNAEDFDTVLEVDEETDDGA